MAKFKNRRVRQHERLAAANKRRREHPSPWFRTVAPPSLLKRRAAFAMRSKWLTGMRGASVHGGKPRAAR